MAKKPEEKDPEKQEPVDEYRIPPKDELLPGEERVENGEAHEEGMTPVGGPPVEETAQMGFNEETLDKETTASLLQQVGLRMLNQEAAALYNKANREIKKILPLDGKDHRIRLNESTVVKITPSIGGQKINFIRQNGHRVTYEIKVPENV